MTIGQLFVAWFTLSCLAVPLLGACMGFGLRGRKAADRQRA